MTGPSNNDKYVGRTSSEFPYDDVRKQAVFEDATLLAFFMKRYGTAEDPGDKVVVTTFADWSVNSFEVEHYFPLQIAVEVQDADERTVGRIEADYQICFYSFLAIDREHFSQFVEDVILPSFWEMVDESLSAAMIAMRFNHGLLEDKIHDYR